jgi:hypothetical protein
VSAPRRTCSMIDRRNSAARAPDSRPPTLNVAPSFALGAPCLGTRSDTPSFRQLVCGRRVGRIGAGLCSRLRHGSLISVSTCILHRWAARGQMDEGEGLRPHLQHGLEGSREPRLHEMAGIYAATMNNGYEARDPTEDEARVLSHFQCADGSTEYTQSTSSLLPELPGIRLPAWAVSVRAQTGRRGFRPNIQRESI